MPHGLYCTVRFVCSMVDAGNNVSLRFKRQISGHRRSSVGVLHLDHDAMIRDFLG